MSNPSSDEKFSNRDEHLEHKRYAPRWVREQRTMANTAAICRLGTHGSGSEFASIIKTGRRSRISIPARNVSRSRLCD